jgi:hypothetical protein
MHLKTFKLSSLLTFISWAFVFAVIYAQSPLYTSNQNQYFIHGLASAGYGYLQQDWLANTLDPTPVFSLLVRWSYTLMGSELIFYAFYALLLGIYLWSVLGIVDAIFHLRRSRTRMVVFLTLFLGIHSAAWRYFLSITAGPDWTYVLEGGVAGQRLLGSVFEPSVFGVFLVLSVYLFLRERVYLAILAMAVAVLFHPTYLLSAAMLTLGYMWSAYREEARWRKPFSLGFTALALVSPVLLYVYTSFGAASSMETAARARQILVEFRIPHHALVSDWLNLTVLAQVMIVSAALVVVRRTRLFPIMLISAGLAVALTLVQVILKSNALALLFPWRISVILVPLSSSILAAFLVSRLFDRVESLSAAAQNAILITSMAGIIVLMLAGATRFRLDLERKENDPANAMLQFVGAHKQSGQVYLIPTKLQDFRLETGAPAYVDFKSIPYAQGEVLEWYRRVRLANRFYREKKDACEMLRSFAQEEAITHVVLEDGSPAALCENLQEIYKNENYAVYALEGP